MPEMQIRNTYYQLGKIYVYKLKVKEACTALKQAEDITQEILCHGDNSNLIYLSKCYGLVKEVHLKAYSQRNPSALDEAQRAADECMKNLQTILGDDDKPRYLIAKALLHQGNTLIQRKKVEDAEKVLLRAQTMISSLYSENHPCILEFNSNLVEIYASMQDEEQKKKTVQITEKNLEIAKEFYDEDSLFILRHHLAAASNKIG